MKIVKLKKENFSSFLEGISQESGLWAPVEKSEDHAASEKAPSPLIFQNVRSQQKRNPGRFFACFKKNSFWHPSLLAGRTPEEDVSLTPRICAICSVSHKLAAIRFPSKEEILWIKSRAIQFMSLVIKTVSLFCEIDYPDCPEKKLFTPAVIPAIKDTASWRTKSSSLP